MWPLQFSFCFLSHCCIHNEVQHERNVKAANLNTQTFKHTLTIMLGEQSWICPLFLTLSKCKVLQKNMLVSRRRNLTPYSMKTPSLSMIKILCLCDFCSIAGSCTVKVASQLASKTSKPQKQETQEFPFFCNYKVGWYEAVSGFSHKKQVNDGHRT